MVERKLIKLFCLDKEVFLLYYKYINISYIKTNYNNIYKLLETINNYYYNYKETISITKEELIINYSTNYHLTDSERDNIEEIINSIFEEVDVNSSLIIKYLESHRKRALSGEIAKMALDVEDGKATQEDLVTLFKEMQDDVVVSSEVKPVIMDLNALHKSQVATPGLRWRLNFLNKALGSLRKGDFGFIFARPETGKTTFLASEISYMIEQTEGDILWFNNEEQGAKVGIRVFQAVLNKTPGDLWIELERNQTLYNLKTGNRIHILDYEDSNSSSRIEEVLKLYKPALIIFDQIDKIKGFKGDRDDLRLKVLYQWAREIAKTYAPVIAVSQASGEAEGKLWLTMDMVDGSKTAKQGEADWIIGIGKEQDNTSRTRFLNICKNKLIGDEDTLPDLRHGNAQVLMRAEVARFEDMN